jgi:hypothetical protein
MVFIFWKKVFLLINKKLFLKVHAKKKWREMDELLSHCQIHKIYTFIAYAI